MSILRSILPASALALSLAVTARPAAAAPPTKDECLEAHGKGQDAREAGQLSRASTLFLTCAQAACPDLVRADCARLADELDRQKPTVTFAARDGARRDLPDTAVYVDGAQVAGALSDGKAYDVDPGRHEVRFVHGADEVTLTVVVNQGEKGRAVVGTFAAGAPAAPSATAVAEAPPRVPEAPEPRRAGGPLVLVGLGAVAAVAGGVLFGVGLARVPATCDLSAHTCAAPPGDPAFGKAAGGVTLMNVGGVVGGAGVVALGGALVWYFAQPLRPARALTAFAPWAGPRGAGVTLTLPL
jgi:hypothetical protein